MISRVRPPGNGRRMNASPATRGRFGSSWADDRDHLRLQVMLVSGTEMAALPGWIGSATRVGWTALLLVARDAVPERDA